MWAFPQKVQAAFSSSCLFRNLWSGPWRIDCLPLCFPLKSVLWSFHLTPKPQFIFYFIFWVTASWKVYVWAGRWEWERGEVTKPKERREAKPFLFRIVQCTGSLPKPETKWYSSRCRNGAVPMSQALICTHLWLGKCRIEESSTTYSFYSLRLSARAWNSDIWEVYERSKLNANGKMTSSVRRRIEYLDSNTAVLRH